MFKDIFSFSGIRKRLIIYYLITTILLGAISLFSYWNAKMTLVRLKSIITDYVYLNDLNNDVNMLTTEVEKYLTTKSSEALLSYYTIYNNLEEKAANIPREAVNDVDSLILKDIGYMIDNLLIETDKAVKAKRGRISNEYIAHFTRTNQISEYIKYYINSLLNNKLQNGSQKYDVITKNMAFISYINLILIVASVIINIFLAIGLTYRLTKPIIELAHSAERVSKGDFNIEPTKIKTNDEINVLANAFNKMIINIRSHIDEIKGQAEVENRLKEQEMQNLKMKNLLKEAQLKSLQSQINPHFLFNTLNAASQLSMMEGADKASEFIENVAELFRYNLKRLDEPVTLAEEIRNVQNYMSILKTRFGNRIEFFIKIDESVTNIKIPCTIIQPIVENAYVHGLEDLERNGEIYLNVIKARGKILIEVRDNGEGMEKNRIEAIISDNSNENLLRRHVTGIGINNVVNRIGLFFNVPDIKDIIEIESELGYGTKVTLKIPYCGEGVFDDKAINC